MKSLRRVTPRSIARAALLEVSGKGEALKGARRELSARFARKRRTVEAVPA